LGSFEKWSRIVGGILEYCGVEGFLENIEEIYESSENEDQYQWAEFFEIIYSKFGESPFMTKDIVREISNIYSSIRTVIPENLGNIQDTSFSRRLGRALMRRKDQVFEIESGVVRLRSGMRDGHLKQPKWFLAPVKNCGVTGFAGYVLPDLIVGEKLINSDSNVWQIGRD
jgi:hypothetical protein